MDDSRQRLVKAGYTSDVINRLHTARRASTNNIYKSKWDVFTRYCEERGINPSHATAGNITQFLNYLDTVHHRAPSTIKAYRAAIGHMTRSTSGYNPGDDQVCSLLIKSIERSKPPSFNRVPQWDVSIVLTSLLKPENRNDNLSRHLLTAKTTFLLALATGERRSGLHALSANVQLSDDKPPTLHLTFVRDFVPKAWFLRQNKVRLEPLVLPCVDDPESEAICPVHTVINYLSVVKSSRTRAQTSLLIPHAPTNTKNLSLQAVPRYIIKLVHWAYENLGLTAPAEVRGHDTRGLAASLAALTGASLPDVLASGNWASANTFLRHYFKRFSPDAVHSFASIPKFVAGKKLIDTSSVAGLSRSNKSEDRAAAATTTTRASRPQPSETAALTRSVNPRGSRAEDEDVGNLVLSPNSGIRRVVRIPATSRGQPAQLIGVQQRTLAWLREHCSNVVIRELNVNTLNDG